MAELMHKKCENCGAEFDTDRQTKRFCTRKCKNWAQHLRSLARKPKKYPEGFRNSPKWRAVMSASRRRWAAATLEQRFWAKVQKTDGCWLWIGNIDVHGYGVFKFDGRPQKAHRFSLLLANGSLNPKLGVLHSCDNPACVNPAHLREGTQLDNVKDTYEHGKLSCKTPDELHAMAVRRANIRWGNEVLGNGSCPYSQRRCSPSDRRHPGCGLRA